MASSFPPGAGAEPVGRSVGRRPRRVQIRARGLPLLPQQHGPTAGAQRAAAAGLLVRPGARLNPLGATSPGTVRVARPTGRTPAAPAATGQVSLRGHGWKRTAG